LLLQPLETTTAKSQVSEFVFSKEILIEMLTEENALRLSPETQALYRVANEAAEHKGGMRDWLDVTQELQTKLVVKFLARATPPVTTNEKCIERGLWLLRTAHQRFPDLRHLSLYVKFNRARLGDLRLGDDAPNPLVKTLDGVPRKLLLEEDAGNVVVVAGSYT
jgi:hypothetical protein